MIVAAFLACTYAIGAAEAPARRFGGERRRFGGERRRGLPAGCHQVDETFDWCRSGSFIDLQVVYPWVGRHIIPKGTQYQFQINLYVAGAPKSILWKCDGSNERSAVYDSNYVICDYASNGRLSFYGYNCPRWQPNTLEALPAPALKTPEASPVVPPVVLRGGPAASGCTFTEDTWDRCRDGSFGSSAYDAGKFEVNGREVKPNEPYLFKLAYVGQKFPWYCQGTLEHSRVGYVANYVYVQIRQWGQIHFSGQKCSRAADAALSQ